LLSTYRHTGKILLQFGRPCDPPVWFRLQHHKLYQSSHGFFHASAWWQLGLITSLDETTEGKPIYFARVFEIDGCFGQGETPEESIADLRLAIVDFIESLLVDGLPVPDPTSLLKPTLGTAIQGSYTFIKQDNSLKLKQYPIDHNAYFLSVSEK
jgi:predicted RNase H-like HicB family nuclease